MSRLTKTSRSYYTTYLLYGVIALGVLLKLWVSFSYTSKSKDINLLKYSREILFSVKKMETQSIKHGLFYENTSKNIISVNIMFKGGAALDPKGYDGISYLLANALVQGAGGYSPYEFKKLLEDYSISIDTSTERDKIIVNISTLSYYRNHLFDILDMVINRPNLGQRELAISKNNLLVEYNVNTANPTYFVEKSLRRSLFGNSPYFKDIVGNPRTIARITPEILARFKSRVITKDNLYVAVSGNISQGEVENNLEKIFAKLPHATSNITLPKITPRIVNKTISVPIQNVAQSEVYMVFSSPDFKSIDYPYAQVVNTYLGRIPDSALFQELRNNQGLVYTVSSSLLQNALTHYWVVSLGSSLNTADQAIDEVKRVLQESRKNTNYKNIIIAKDWLLANELNFFSNNEEMAHTLNTIQFRNQTIGEFIESRNTMNSISKVNYQDILDNLDLDNITIVKIVKKK
ncbi:insulinase family protein [Candidatus Hepatincola sp. Pdp]